MTDMVPCAHCGLKVKAESNRGQVFCCDGCRTAHAIIAGCGLQNYYALHQGSIVPPNEDIGVIAFASEAFQQNHIIQRNDGLAEVIWFVQGVHCTACLWLLEQLPLLDAGVRQARLAFSESRLSVIYDPNKTSPAQQATIMARLGYPVRPFSDGEKQVRNDLRNLLLRLAVAASAAIGSMHLSLNLYAGELTKDLDDAGARWFSWLALVVVAPAIGWSALPMYRAGWAALRLGRPSVDLTATVVITIGVIASMVNVLRGSRETYVDALAMFIAFLLAGRFAVMAARNRARAQMANLDGVLPSTALRLQGQHRQRVACDQLRAGDVIELMRSEVVPCDGVALSSLSVDAAVLNGESRPQLLKTGSTIYAGTTCLTDSAQMSVTVTGVATRIGNLIREANRAADRPTRLVADIDRWQGWFMAVVGAVAISVLGGWWWFGAPSFGVNQAIAVILVSCPCALGLATPLVLAMASSRAASRGIMLRDPSALEWLGRPGGLRHVVLDKTGTLTEGRTRVVAWEWLGELTTNECSSLTALVVAAEARSAHPIALGIVAYLGSGVEPVSTPVIHHYEERPGHGLIATTEMGTLCIGNARLTGMDLAESAESAPSTEISETRMEEAIGHLGVTLNGRPVARIRCADPIRIGVAALISRFHAMGATVHMLSGDDPVITAAVARHIGLPPSQALGGLLPEEKATRVALLKKDGAVAVIGDGINDAAALGIADVGIGLRGGIEAALGSCRVVMMRHDVITALHELLTGASRARVSVSAILLISLAYNIIGVTLAAAGIWGPLVCAVAMPLSSLTAILMAAGGRYFVNSSSVAEDRSGSPEVRKSGSPA
jgi:P-type Cu2+ transporter